jgi:hypothetical protein
MATMETTMIIDWFTWTCPRCSKQNRDDIDSELGPFFTAVCDDCGFTSDQQTVGAVYDSDAKEQRQ